MKNRTFQKLPDSKEAIEMSTKLRLLTEVTFNLKCAAFKIVDLPIQTFKQKSSTMESSFLTTLDSIFHDLKRVETLLTQHSRKYDMKQNKNLSFNYNFQESERSVILKNFDKKSAKIDSSKNISFQRQISELSLQYDLRRDNLKKTKKINHVVTQSSHTNQKTEFGQYWDQNSQVNQNLLMPYQKDHRKSNKNLNITKVSSTQYLGLSPNPIINIKSQFKYQNKETSPPRSEISYQKASVDWKSIQEEEHLKDKQNQQFVQSIQKKRQLYLKSISKKKEKCFNTIERINQQMQHSREKSVSANKHKGSDRKKSKTEKFKKYEYKKDENIMLI